MKNYNIVVFSPGSGEGIHFLRSLTPDFVHLHITVDIVYTKTVILMGIPGVKTGRLAMNKTVVQKFGGSSLSTLEHIRSVASKIKQTRESGASVAVVVSAMGGETDRMLEMIHQLNQDPPGREQDCLVATGEQACAALMAAALENLGCPARSFLGLQLPLHTDEAHTRARIASLEGERIKKALDEGNVAVVAGFQGINYEGDITTLGRGGSDTTAVALAASLKADACEIYTDVDGIYTTDPSICPRAQHLKRITYEEILELAGLGAKVLQSRSVELARKFYVPLVVKSSFGGSRGTWIVKEEDVEMESAVVSGITLDRNEGKLTVIKVPDRPGIAHSVISPLAEASINVDMIIQNVSSEGYTDFTFTVPAGDLERAREIVEKEAQKIGAREVRSNDAIAKVSAVGIGMKNHPGVAAKMFQTLSHENINIQMISTSEIRISCVIDSKYGELAVRVLHQAFGLDKEN